MDNSQCSISISEVDCEIDILCYEELLSELKDCFNLVTEDVSEHLAKILKKCEECISQTFDIIIDLKAKLTDEKKLGGLLENAITILKMLTRHLKNLEEFSLTCSANKLFPTTTGNIIYAVFNHCKNSEQLYGIYLKSLENQLKDLFRTCHELQLIYLMIFEKCYTINLDAEEEQEVLLASLEINLNICDIAQTLDIKTMAEHWKAYTAICEKHAQYLEKMDVFSKCIENVVVTVKNNMNFEQMEDDKVIVRSLKVTAFVIKILSKLANIFKRSIYKHEIILQLFIFVYQYKNELFNGKATKHSNLIESLIMSPVDHLLKDVLSEDLINFILTLPLPKPEKVVSYVLLLTSIMRLASQNMHQIKDKERLIRQLFIIFPYCHNLFLKPSRLRLNNKTYEIYQYLLIHTVGLAGTFSQEEYTKLEQILFHALLSTDCYSAIFASDLWVILCRNNTQLQLNTVTGLIRNYQKLESNEMFQIAPQKQYMLHAIQKMFKNLQYEEKILIYRQCSIQDARNSSVWTVMMVHLPDNIRGTAENIVTERCIRYLEDFLKLKNIQASDMNVAIQNIKFISNCISHRDIEEIEKVLVNCWLKCCPSSAIQNCLKNNNLMYLKYIEALSNCSRNFIKHFEGTSVEKIIHVVFKLIKLKNIQLTLILFEFCCELLYAIEMFCFLDDYLYILDEIFLSVDKDNMKHLFITAMSKPYLNKFISEHLRKESMLREVCNDFEVFKTTLTNSVIKSDFGHEINNAFTHKCVHVCDEVTDIENISQKEADSNKLEWEEPVSKKLKTDYSVIEEIITCIESKVSQLDREKETLTDEHRNRLSNISHKLKGMI